MISDDFLDIISFVVNKYDTSDNINFIEKYKFEAFIYFSSKINKVRIVRG